MGGISRHRTWWRKGRNHQREAEAAEIQPVLLLEIYAKPLDREARRLERVITRASSRRVRDEGADDSAAVIVERVKEAIAAADAVEKTIAVKVLTPDVALKKMFNRFVRGVNKDRWYPEKDERDA